MSIQAPTGTVGGTGTVSKPKPQEQQETRK